MRIISWNINSLRLRLPLLKELIDLANPDIICLQETKVPDNLFPQEDIKALGYPYIAYKGMKSYNGVCILSKHSFEISPSSKNWCNQEDCRHLAVDFHFEGKLVTLHNFYVPAGGDEPDPSINTKFEHKLNFLKETTDWFKKNIEENSILVGDLNIAPLEHDVWSHKQLLKVVSHTPIETQKLTSWLKTGFIDAMREIVPSTEKLYTWWSYRNKDWEKSNRGRRLDHLWITPSLAPYLQTIQIFKEVRNWEKPSDHVPILLELKENLSS
ncbi:exodeoxyribonuclease III [Commensalibacter papalotli (ex Botero et al. 2024)]|uniref:Exonuclease III (XthA) (PDB:1AKO) n=1 Tax=Commensalibacter papalotli (ex Botero et al. 2024) TaxID=2972766 RepID=A0ABM9HIF9_9PROT|nr:exodeoxyribonuclease III [Commensalibacter papalotli (ex Botero et al. 2024)]CAI3924732.1 Exonuclease III (XthA) (PDB:1AKO) [Commensalibacter papalotli (ex Botero et al. 2024)]CAI3927356.1 Exonuclease III (XthA) (PDB:1AKO) [Commensalibacter papalotli (ex Botero et al. 2024)]